MSEVVLVIENPELLRRMGLSILNVPYPRTWIKEDEYMISKNMVEVARTTDWEWYPLPVNWIIV